MSHLQLVGGLSSTRLRSQEIVTLGHLRPYAVTEERIVRSVPVCLEGR